jgi:hypothetical protein
VAGKYADRFRPQPHEPGGPDVVHLGVVDHSIGTDLDHEDAHLLEPARGQAWHRSAMARLALVVAVAVGVAGGAYGWEQWRVHKTDVASRSAVDLVASGMTLDFSGNGDLSVGLTYRNDGAHELVVRDAWFESPNLEPLGDPSVLEIAPGGHKGHFFTMGVACPNDQGSSIDPPLLHVKVETADGAVRDIALESDLLGAQVADWVFNNCMSMSYVPTAFAETYADFTLVAASEDGLTVHTEANLGFGADVAVRIDSVEPSTPAYAVEYAVGDTFGDFGPSMTIDFQVADCARALDATEADMMVTIFGAIEGTSPGQLTTYPTPQLAIALTRLAERSCQG